MATITDIFAGAGGSSTGAASVPGVDDKIAALHLDEMSYENPTSALESISMLVADTGRAIAEGWDE